MKDERRVVVFGLGGTIAMSASAQGGVTPSLSAHDLVMAVPGLADTGVAIDVVDVRRLPSPSLDFGTLGDLTAAVTAAIEQGATGVVITQGTDTIEETSYLFDLCHHHVAPLVVTGAMRSPTMAGADGPANLLAAVLTAADPQAQGLGALVVLNDEVHSAQRVSKTHATALGSFQSPNGGPLGFLIEGDLRLSGVSPPRLALPAPTPSVNPMVAIHTAVLGDDPAVVGALAEHVDGLVVAGMGAGHVPEILVDPLAKLAAHIPVVLTSRTGCGPVLRRTYGYPGSERDLIGHGLIPAGSLHPLKARILLRCLLACHADGDQILKAFAVAGQYANHTEWPWPHNAWPGPSGR
jgi:L-asparaginase